MYKNRTERQLGDQHHRRNWPSLNRETQSIDPLFLALLPPVQRPFHSADLNLFPFSAVPSFLILFTRFFFFCTLLRFYLRLTKSHSKIFTRIPCTSYFNWYKRIFERKKRKTGNQTFKTSFFFWFTYSSAMEFPYRMRHFFYNNRIVYFRFLHKQEPVASK